MIEEFSPLDTFSLVLRRWWWVVALTIVGGLAGWLATWFKPPLYEAKAVFTVTIDFIKSGELDEREQDQYVGAVIALITSTPVIEQVKLDAAERQIPMDALVVGQRVIVERKQSQLVLRVRNADPQIAATIANLWAERALANLLEAHRHAIRAQVVWVYIQGLSQCGLGSLQTDGSSDHLDGNVPAICGSVTLEALQQSLRTAETELQTEIVASRSLIPAINFSLEQKAQPSDTPVVFNSRWLVLGGMLIGFVLGVGVATARRFSLPVRSRA